MSCTILSYKDFGGVVQLADYATGRPLKTLLVSPGYDYSGIGFFYSFLWFLGLALQEGPTL